MVSCYWFSSYFYDAMDRLFSLLLLFALMGYANVVLATPNPEACCSDCTCIFCGHQMSCGFLDPANCNEGGTNFCGNDGDTATTDTPCTYFWDNTFLQGELPRTDPTDGASENCVPIDGGLGFLIAGGLGIGVIGIRRRKEELVSERA